MTKHAKISPSSMNSIVHCAGYFTAKNKCPARANNSVSGEGNIAHDYSAKMITGQGDIPFVSDEIAFHCQPYIDLLAGKNAAIEQPVSCSVIYPDCWGTPDAWYYDAPTNTLYVYDLKYGYGIVEVYLNYQLLCYAAGIISSYQLNALKIVLCIFQPRAYHPQGAHRVWEVSYGDLVNRHIPVMIEAVKNALNMGQCATGNHCRYCKGLLFCDAAWLNMSSVLEVSCDQSFNVDDPVNVAKQYVMLKKAETLIAHHLTRAEEMVHQYKSNGDHVPLLETYNGRGSTKWLAEKEDSVKLLAELEGVDLNNLCSPSQAKKRGMPEEVVNSLSKKIPGKVGVRVSNMKKISSIFGD